MVCVAVGVLVLFTVGDALAGLDVVEFAPLEHPVNERRTVAAMVTLWRTLILDLLILEWTLWKEYPYLACEVSLTGNLAS